MSSKLRTVSWVLIALVGALTLVGSLASAYTAYGSGTTDELGPGAGTVNDLAGSLPAVATSIRARRGTAAAFAASYAVLLLWITLVPYRRGEVWSWWALLSAVALLAVLTALRIPTLGMRPGAATGAAQLLIVGVALLLDVGRLRGRGSVA